MVQTLNLVPEEEIKVQVQAKVVKFSTVITLILLVIVSAAVSVVWYKRNELVKQKDSLNAELADLRTQISKDSDLEIRSRNLAKRTEILTKILTDRKYYSTLVREFDGRTASGVSIKSFDFGKDAINVSGYADSYISLSRYVENLFNRQGNLGSPGFEKLFTAVKINSVQYEKGSARVSFSVSITADLALINTYGKEAL